MIFYIWYCLIENPKYQYLVVNWEVLIFAITALVFATLFIPKVFYNPRYNSQNSARIALMFFIILSMFLQFISLKEIVLYAIGKTHQINNLNEINAHPESS